MKKYPVHEKDLKAGAKHEMEHTASPTTARRIARQHLEHHPTYYKVLPVAEKMMEAREKNIKPVKKRRPPVPLSQRMMTWTPTVRY